MEPRQFKKLANETIATRRAMLVEGLTTIGENVRALAGDIERCAEVGANRSATITDNVMSEEIGKFLILMDIFRAPPNNSTVTGTQLKRVTDHLSKLIYHETSRYHPADRDELVRLVEPLRKSHYLDGPFDADWIFRNSLIDQRERELYVDLVISDGELTWWKPFGGDVFWGGSHVSQLVVGILDCGLVSEEGFSALEAAWDGFDASANTRSTEWRERNLSALGAVQPPNGWSEEQIRFGNQIVQRWLMPMSGLDISEIKVDLGQLEAERQKILEARMREML